MGETDGVVFRRGEGDEAAVVAVFDLARRGSRRKSGVCSIHFCNDSIVVLHTAFFKRVKCKSKKTIISNIF